MTRPIQFIDESGDVPEQFHPVPAAKEIPEWYRKLSSYADGKQIPDLKGADETAATVKKCRPVFDAISSGYLLRLPVDVHVELQQDGHYFSWPDRGAIEFHPVKQLPTYPGKTGRKQPYPKFIHPWGIKTPPGYSTLFTSPFHHDVPFHTLEGIVDTDTYNLPVQLPFFLKDDKFEGLIKAGTPIAQVIPFKRDSWKMSITQNRKDFELQNRRARRKINAVFNNAYSLFFWQRKEYR